MNEAGITLVVAMAENRVIGRDGGMPWHLRSDLKRFRAVTWGKPIVMGRRTWDAIGRPLEGRKSIVVTSDESFAAEGAEVVHSVETAIERARQAAVELGTDEIAIIGGGEIYRQTLGQAQRVHLTEIRCSPEGDTFFPELDPGQWTEESRAPHDPAEGDDCPFTFVEYVRRSASDVT